MKDYNYYPQRSSGRHRHRRNRQMCDCPMPHPYELVKVTRERHLDPIKACADWHRGKRVCPECRFLANMENHHLRCSAAAPRAPLADITPPQEDQEAAQTEPAADPIAAATMIAALQNEKLTLLGETVTMIHQTTTQDARRNHVVDRTLAQRINESHDADQQQLQRMANTLEIIIAEQQRMNEQIQARQQASRPVRIYRTPIRRRAVPTRHDLAGASVWTGDVLSRISRDRLVSAAAGAAVTLAVLWLGLVPLPQPRSSYAPRRLARSYRSGSDIPQTRPPAGLDPSPLFPFGYACASFPLLSLLCCLRVLSPVIVTCVVSLWLCLRVLSLFLTACVSFLLLPRIECWPRGGRVQSCVSLGRSVGVMMRRNCVSLAGKM